MWMSLDPHLVLVTSQLSQPSQPSWTQDYRVWSKWLCGNFLLQMELAGEASLVLFILTLNLSCRMFVQVIPVPQQAPVVP